MKKKTVALTVTLNMIISPVLHVVPVFAAPARNEVPVVKPGGTLTGATIAPVVNNAMTINQNQSKAIIDWKSFNIGKDATVYFSQKDARGVAQSSWTALNRIYDKSASQIFGKLVADGKVYLINQNGILFGKDSQVNVNTLVASTMNIRNKDFLNDTLRFTAENYQHQDYVSPLTFEEYLVNSPAASRDDYLGYYDGVITRNLSMTALSPTDTQALIDNQGNISTSVGGAVYLIGPGVKNSGAINTPTGVTALVAGTRGTNTGNYDLLVTDTRDTDALTTTQSTLTLNESFRGGDAVNTATGKITADRGQVGMYGKLVEQNGVIRAVTAVKKGGKIELLATGRIVTGAGSVTSTPINDSSETADSTFGKKSGSVILAGLTVTKGDHTTTYAPPAQIEHHGAIEAHSGSVVMEASERILLDSGSSIDVSGVWADRAATAVLINPQLNSVNLRDDFGQKNGLLLGEYVWVDSRTGTSIGDVSGYYKVAEMTARERNTVGGSISLGAHTLSSSNTNISDSHTTKSVVVKEGAFLGFAGGGYRYAAGIIPTTKLLSGNTLYDIASAPEWLAYRKIMTVNSYSAAFTEGHNAGSLAIEARQTALNGRLSGAAYRGFYQTQAAELIDAHGNQKTQGVKEALGGTLTIGSATKLVATSDETNMGRADYITDRIVLTGGSNTPEEPDGTSYLSTEMLNHAGLGALNLNANESVAIDPTARLDMTSAGSGSTISINARKIDVYGSIDAPGGSVTLTGVNNKTSFEKGENGNANPEYRALTERIFLADNSRISVAGERIDNSVAARGGATQLFGHTGGGKITLSSYSYNSDGVFVQSGALLDVSGGYSIAPTGKVGGGNAGELSLAGPNLIIDGNLRGLALLGSRGGKIKLTSEKVAIGDAAVHLPVNFGSDTPLTESLRQGLALTDDRLALTGFSRIELNSFGDAALSGDVALSPSMAVLATPVAGGKGDDYSYVIAGADDIGSSSIQVAAGVTREDGQITRDYAERFSYFAQYPYDTSKPPHTNYASRLTMEKGARIEVAPGGAIILKGPGATMNGTLSARAGSVAITVKTNASDETYPGAESGILKIGSTAVIDVGGYNKRVIGTVGGVPAGYTALDGGSIALSSTDNGGVTGDIVVAGGARLDVSGSAPATSVYRQADGSRGTAAVAAAPGSISLTYLNNLDLEGNLAATGQMAGLKGGALTISKVNTGSGLTLTEDELNRYQQAGFDAFTFQSRNSLIFSGNPVIQGARVLTLDAPKIDGSGASAVALSAAWLTLTNSYYPDGNLNNPAAGSAALTLAGEYIDVTGAVSLSGFSTVGLAAREDIRLTDLYYTDSNGLNAKPQMGRLSTAGDLTLQAAAIYPTSQSVFAISAGGKITTRPGDHDSTGNIYSALGNLTLSAGNGIDHEGYLAAPLGQLTLDSGAGMLFLGEGSITTTSTGAAVKIGALDEDGVWLRRDRSYATLTAGQTMNSSDAITVTATPEKGITLTGNEVVTTDGATIDASGKGSIFAALFTSDLNGTVNPISVTGINGSTRTRSDRFVILADNSVNIPGYTYSYIDTDGTQKSKTVQAIHLESTRLADGTILKAGTYSILPEEFAFMPGAMIVSSLGKPIASGTHLTSTEGYNVVAGYSTAIGTTLQPGVMTAYTVRSASDVLKEGHFDTRQLVAGEGGSLKISGKSAVIGGDIRLGGLSGFNGGTVSVSGSNVLIASSGDLFNGTPLVYGSLPSSLSGKVVLSAGSLSNQGIQSLKIGESTTDVTDSITLQEGTELTIPEITFKAGRSITLEANAQLNAVSDSGGTLSLSGETITLGLNSLAHSGGDLNLRAKTLDLQGDLKVDSGTLGLYSSSITIAADDAGMTATGLYLTNSQLNRLGSISSMGLYSDSDLQFYGKVALDMQKKLTIDAARISGTGEVDLAAAAITMQNSGKDANAFNGNAPTLDDSLTAGGGKLSLTAGQITVNAGNSDDDSFRFDNERKALWNILLDGFSNVKLAGGGDLTFQGVGALKTAAALDLQGARITATPYSSSLTSYKSTRFTIDAGKSSVTIGKGSGEAGTATSSGGSLEIRGGEIVHNGIIELPSGSVTLAAINGVTLGSGAEIKALGSKAETREGSFLYAPGGDVTIRGGTTVTLAAGSLVDVSAVEQGDAGRIDISGPGGVTLNGALTGKKGGGSSDQGGSFALDAATVADLDTLSTRLAAGGFDQEIAVRARQGNLALSKTKTMTAHQISLAADGGDITISGKLDASGDTGGGRIELAANHDLNLEDGSRLLAGGVTGGEVVLKAGNVESDGNNPGGTLYMKKGALIDVSGADAETGGTVRFQAMRNAAGDNVLLQFVDTTLNDTVTGASMITAEATRVYSLDGGATTNLSTMLADAGEFVSTAGDGIVGRILGGKSNAAFHLLAGIEARSSGDITLSDLAGDADLTSCRFGGEAGVLTLRAGGNLNIDTNLLDHPSSDNNALRSYNAQSSWGFNLVAGADLKAANPLAANKGKSGDLVVQNGVMVYSESGPINFVSAGDTTLNQAYTGTGIVFNDMFNSLGAFSGNVRGHVGGNLNLNGGVIQTATGNIDLKVGGDVTLKRNDITGYGAIRTTGEPAATIQFPKIVMEGEEYDFITDPRLEIWNYQNGGNIALNARGSVSGAYQAVDAWDYATDASYTQENNGFDFKFQGWSARYGKLDGDITLFDNDQNADKSSRFTQGIATMAGGSVTIRSGADVASQVGTFGEGDLKVYARGDLYGRYLVSGSAASEGNGSLMAMGNIGVAPAISSTADYRQPVVELRYARDFSATAFGGITLGMIMNPTLVGMSGHFSGWFPTYSRDGRVSLTSLGGDVSLLGSMYTIPNYKNASLPPGSVNLISTSILPSSLNVSAAGDFTINQDVVLAPAADGALHIHVGGSISGSKSKSWKSILMSDMAATDEAGGFYAAATTAPDLITSYNALHGASPADGIKALHAVDTDPAEIIAGGDISNLQIYLPKHADIAAGEELRNLFISTQNQTAGDLTSITAGGDILFAQNPLVTADSGIEHAGPGSLVVSAGGSIDLGNSNGIRTVGNSYNSYLASDGSDLVLLAGTSDSRMLPDEASALFKGLREAGEEYNTLVAEGKKDEAEAAIREAREELVAPLFRNAPQGSGTINMVSSQISSVSENADIYIFAGNKINVGRTSLTQKAGTAGGTTKQTGIFTARGGAINVLSIGDINVNQSRIMTFFGGDITLWSDQGDINAGRGSKTSVSASPPVTKFKLDTQGNVLSSYVVFEPPAVGSGIRALTYDPNTTPGGGLETPDPGDVNVYTPQGTIDAGEAGIAGGKVTLVAVEVLNAQNISFSAGSVGVPSASDAGVSLGALTGAGSVAETSKMVANSSALGSARDKLAQQANAVDDFMSKWLDVKVIDFDKEEGDADKDKEDEEKEKKK